MSEFPKEDRQSRFGLTHEELTEEFAKLGDDDGLIEDFTDGELWPTEGLTDKQIELLTSRLLRIEAARRREQRRGRS